MPVVGAEFWAEIDQRVTGASFHWAERSTVRPSLPMPVSEANDPQPEPLPTATAEPDWDRVLNTIDEARTQARAQAEAYRRTIQELRQETDTIWQQVRSMEAQARESKAEAERQVGQILAHAEERVRKLQAEADARVAEAQASAQRNAERIGTDRWSKRVEAATVTLAPLRAASSIRWAA